MVWFMTFLLLGASPNAHADGGAQARQDVAWQCDLDPGQVTRGACPTAWPDGVVYFDFDSGVTALNRDLARIALGAWIAADAGVVFLPRTTETPYVRLRNGPPDALGGSATVGVAQDGSGYLQINEFLWGLDALVIHESGHTLGLWHEQSRPDRGPFIDVYEENVKPEARHNFEIEACWLTLATPYDFLSIMHYRECQNTLDVCECVSADSPCPGMGRAMVCRPPYEIYQLLMGNQLVMSDYDKQDVQDIYGRGIARYVDRLSQAVFEQGTLAEPYRFVTSGISALQPGSSLCIREGTYASPSLITKRMVMRAYWGSVILTN